MSSSKDDAMKKFWQLPELVEKLLMFLVVKSVLNLLMHQPLRIEILKNRSKMWKGLDNVQKIIWAVHSSNAPWAVEELERDIYPVSQ